MGLAERANAAHDEVGREAEAIWRLVVDATRDDLRLLRERFPEHHGADYERVKARVLRRVAPDGLLETAHAMVAAAHGGRTPCRVRRRMERYVAEQLPGEGAA